MKQSEGYRIRHAHTSDIPAILEICLPLIERRVLLGKEMVALYEAVQEFLVAVDDADRLIGCGALHVMWQDLAEVRTLAVSDAWRGKGVGAALLDALIERAKSIGVSRIFCLTFEVSFFRPRVLGKFPKPRSTPRLTPSWFARATRASQSFSTWPG